MAHGHPDYGLDATRETIHAVTDLGELAARLGSPNVFDRRGDTIWMTDFEHGIEGWRITLDGAGASVVWTPDYKLRGGFAMKLTAGSTLDRFARIERELAFPVISRLGVEVAFTEDDNLESVDFYITLYTGMVRIEWAFRYDHLLGQTYALTTDEDWVPIGPPVTVYTSDYLFSVSKLVVDPNRALYDKLIAGPATFPLDDIPALVTGDGTLPHLSFQGTIYSQALVNAIVYIDSVIITQNEP